MIVQTTLLAISTAKTFKFTDAGPSSAGSLYSAMRVKFATVGVLQTAIGGSVDGVKV
jgi:hypothetical protein